MKQRAIRVSLNIPSVMREGCERCQVVVDLFDFFFEKTGLENVMTANYTNQY